MPLDKGEVALDPWQKALKGTVRAFRQAGEQEETLAVGVLWNACGFV
jgi:hypothetical protein